MAFVKWFRRTGNAIVVLFATCILSLALQAHAMTYMDDDSQIEGTETRAKVSAAIDAVQKNSKDRASMEIVLQTLPFVVDYEYSILICNFKDPLKTSAFDLIQGYKSVEVLADATNGSDLMATWACRKIVHQSWNNDQEKEIAVGGVINENTKATLKEPVQKVLTRKEGVARAAAIDALLVILPEDQRLDFLKPMLKDNDTKVAISTIVGLGQLQAYDKEIDATVWRLLSTSDDPTLLAVCCQWWWLARDHHDTTITPDQEKVFAKLATNSDAAVRREVADALETYTTPEHPALIALMLKMATNDTDESVRIYAISCLRHAKTQAVYHSITEFAKDPKKSISDAANRDLTEETWDPTILQK